MNAGCARQSAIQIHVYLYLHCVICGYTCIISVTACPLDKSSDLSDVNNYRAVSIANFCSKLVGVTLYGHCVWGFCWCTSVWVWNIALWVASFWRHCVCLVTRRQLRYETGWARRRPTRWLYRSFRSWQAWRSGWMVSRALATSGLWLMQWMCFMRIITAAQMSRIAGTLVMAVRRWL